MAAHELIATLDSTPANDAVIARFDETTEVLRMVGNSAWEAQDWNAARRAYALVLSREPNDAPALKRMGRLHLMRGELDAAIELFSEAFLKAPPDPTTCINLAVACGRKSDFNEALRWCAQALISKPGFLPAYIHMASLYEEMGQLQDATDVVNRGLELHPGDPQLLYAQGVHALMRGDFEKGWKGYEQRVNRLHLAEKLDEYPEWKGESLTRKTILVCWEQGYGDQIMWARYLALLQTTVVLFTRPELARLIAHSHPWVQIVTTDQELAKIEPDYWIAMGSLPLRFHDTQVRVIMADLPAEKEDKFVPGQSQFGPYLRPIPADVERFRELIPADGNLRVGLCWAGSPDHFRDKYRSMKWEEMKPLANTPGCTFYSLQRGGQSSGLPSLVDYCHDLADTAAAIANLDLVISVDTVILHLAGALGKPVLGIVPSEWRWGKEPKVAESRQTDWYPSAWLYPRSQWFDSVLIDLAGVIGTQEKAALPVREVDPILKRETRYGRMSWYRNDTYIGRALDFYGEYSESEADLLARIVKLGDVVIEAGANIGALTVALSDLVGETGMVHAFEPQPLYANLLRRNLDMEGRYAYPYGLALGATLEDITLRHVHIDRIHAPGWASKGEEFQVEQATVDSFNFERLNLLKIDVDGAELLILQGAEQTIARCRPLIYVENDKPAEYPDLMPWLIAHGYRLYQHYAPLFNPNNFAGNPVNVFGSMVSAMLLCIPNERKDLHPGEWGLQRIRAEKVAA